MRITVDNAPVFVGTGSGTHNKGAPTLMFIHGAGMDHTVWVLPARYFARHGYNVVAPDLPGHGQSEGDPLTSIRALSNWCIALQDALGADKAAYVGHSMGSLISYAAATQEPPRVSRIALLGTSAPMPVSDGLLDASRDNDQAAIDMTNTWSHSAKGALGSSGHPGTFNLHTGMRLLERSNAGVLHTDLAACNAFDVADFDALTNMPALVIAGQGDQMTPARSGLAVAASIPECQQTVLPGCGHSMLSEQPNQVLDALASFLLPL